MKPEDVELDTWPRARVGGQTTGKIPSGVWVHHIPSGKKVAVDVYRGQMQNRDAAIELLKKALKEQQTND